MTFEQLNYIVAVDKFGTLKEAAEELHVTLSALSQGLNKIEAELGLTLFNRNRTGSTATKEGTVIVKQAQIILFALADLQESADLMKKKMTGILKVASIPGPFFQLFTATQEMKTLYPDINIQIREQNSQTMLEELQSEKVDLALAVYNKEDLENYPDLHFQKIRDCEMLVVAHKNSPIIKAERVMTDELGKQPVILFDDKIVIGTMNEIKRVFGRNDIVISVNNPHIVEQYVEENKAYTVGLDLTFNHSQRFMQDMQFSKIDFLSEIPTTHSFGIVMKKNRHRTQLMKKFGTHLAEHFQQ